MAFQRTVCFFVALACLPFSGYGYFDNYYQQFPTVSEQLPEYEAEEGKVRVALVLGAGGCRGMAHIGVLEELEQAGITIDMITGCSAGAIVGALYSHTPCASVIKKKFSKLSFSDIMDYEFYFGFYGVCSGSGIQSFLLKHLGKAHFEDLSIPLVVVATDLRSGELVKFNKGAVAPPVHASSAYPFLFEPVKIYGKNFVDGGVVNPIPVSVAVDHKADLIIAVDISPDLPKEQPTNAFGVLKRCSEIQFRHQHDERIKDAHIIISPEISHVGSFDDSKNEEVYKLARKATREALPQILKKIEEIKESSNPVAE